MPAAFYRALDGVIGSDMDPPAFDYLNDIVGIGRTLKDHLEKDGQSKH